MTNPTPETVLPLFGDEWADVPSFADRATRADAIKVARDLVDAGQLDEQQIWREHATGPYIADIRFRRAKR